MPCQPPISHFLTQIRSESQSILLLLSPHRVRKTATLPKLSESTRLLGWVQGRRLVPIIRNCKFHKHASELHARCWGWLTGCLAVCIYCCWNMPPTLTPLKISVMPQTSLLNSTSRVKLMSPLPDRLNGVLHDNIMSYKQMIS